MPKRNDELLAGNHISIYGYLVELEAEVSSKEEKFEKWRLAFEDGRRDSLYFLKIESFTQDDYENLGLKEGCRYGQVSE
jgi:hypothetical protein